MNMKHSSCSISIGHKELRYSPAACLTAINRTVNRRSFFMFREINS